MNLVTKKCFVSTDVHFVENVFPFQQLVSSSTSSTSLFPSISSENFSDDDPLQHSSFPDSTLEPVHSPSNSLPSFVSIDSTSSHFLLDLLELNKFLQNSKGLQDFLLI